MTPPPVASDHPAATTLPRDAALWPWWLAWVLFVVYGSLVPLDFHPLPPAQAWQALLHAPMLDLGVLDRADWIANGVLYFPVGFLSAAMVSGSGRRGVVRALAAALFGLAFGVALAVVVECAQTAFPPRTVSLNDLVAEALGTAVGVVAALAGASRFRDMLSGFGSGGHVLAWRLALFYAVVYPALAMFPFDLLLSAAEWRAKFAGGQAAWWLADSALDLGGVRLVAKLAVETLAVAPLGALWSHGRARRGVAVTTLGSQLLRGALLGLAIETAQLTIASGQSQGASVLTRALGFALGASGWQARAGLHPEALRAWLRRWSWPLLAANVLLLVILGGAWRPPWLQPDAALQRLAGEVSFVPFYYHYYTTEMQALVSLVAVSLSYAPLGLLGWSWGASRGAIGFAAALLAATLETVKLFGQQTHPDPTDIGIAAVAAWATQALLEQLFVMPRGAVAGAWPDTARRSRLSRRRRRP